MIHLIIISKLRKFRIWLAHTNTHQLKTNNFDDNVHAVICSHHTNYYY